MRVQLNNFKNLRVLCFISSWSLIILWHLQYNKINNNLEKMTRQSFNHSSRVNATVSSDNMKFKFILLWSLPDDWPLRHLGHALDVFIKNKCPKINCYVTDDKMILGGNLTSFDAIAFNGCDANLNTPNPQKYLPHERSPHQKYIFFNTEPANYYPIRNKFFNGYFNWTATYRLDSEFIINYVFIRNLTGAAIGPKLNMTWIKQVDNDDVEIKVSRKRFAAAWFVSHCKSLSRREDLVADLQKELQKYNLVVHVYGKCGKFKCLRSEATKCNGILKERYYFYLSFENSLDKDYVTEKLLQALQNDVIPIVFGGANYSRFLPPGSYINSREMSVKELASLMNRLIHNPRLYRKYFWWKKYYTFDKGRKEFACLLCSYLNDDKKLAYSSYRDFVNWWNPK